MENEGPRTTCADALLGMLTMGPMSGYDLKQRIERSIGNFWSESFGQIYPALKQLERDRLVTVSTEGKSGRKVYAITDEGRESMQRWLEVAPRPRVPRNELLLKLFFGGVAAPGVLRSHVLETRARYAADLARYDVLEPLLKTECAGNPGLPYWLTTLRFGLAEARMIIAWCDQTVAALDQLDRTAGPSGGASLQEPLAAQGTMGQVVRI